jgi:hypothetical protein
LETTQIEHTDACSVINSRDAEDAFIAAWPALLLAL